MTFGPAYAACVAAGRRERLGYLPDQEHGRRVAAGALLAAHGRLGANLVAIDKTAHECPVLDQGGFGSCFPAGTLILMADGTERPIEEIAEGNEVRTHTGRRRAVTRVMKRRYDGPLYTLRVKGYGYPLSMTEEHPVLVAENAAKGSRVDPTGRLLEVKAKDISPTDVVLLPARTGPEEHTNALTLRVADFISETVREADGKIRISCARPTHVIPDRIVLDEQFGRLLGLFLAEGSFQKANGLRDGLNFTFARHERDYQNFVVTAIGEIFGAKAVIQETDGRPSVSDVSVGNATLARFFYGLCGEYALEKRVPMPLHRSPRAVRLAAIRGWLEGDGDHDIVRPGKRSAQIHGSTSSLEMHRGFFRLALDSGLKPGATVDAREAHQNAESRTLSFYSSDIYEIFPEARAEVERIGLPTDGPKKYWRHEHGFLCRVKSVEVEQPEEPIDVYNLEVDGEHTYIADGIAVHNCGGHGSSQLISIAHGDAGKPLPWTPSPRYTYTGSRRLSVPATSAGGPPLTDSGIDPSTLDRWFRDFGAVPIGTDGACPTNDGRYSDVDSTNVNLDLQLDAEIAGRQRLDMTPHDVDVSRGTDELGQTFAIKGVGVGLGIFVDRSFENWTPSQGALDGPADLQDPNGGGHWVALSRILGFDTTGRPIWGIVNSWGKQWGDAGHIVVTDVRMSSMLSQAVACQVAQ